MLLFRLIPRRFYFILGIVSSFTAADAPIAYLISKYINDILYYNSLSEAKDRFWYLYLGTCLERRETLSPNTSRCIATQW